MPWWQDGVRGSPPPKFGDGSTGDGGWASAGAGGFARPAVSREGNGTGPNGRIGGD